MTIKETYRKYLIPGNLQQHMLSVAEVVLFIKLHWKGPEVNWDNVVTAALLHDLGNIVRFDFEKHPEFLGEDINRIPELKKLQQRIIARYGNDDHLATQKMLTNIEVGADIMRIILNKSFGNSILIAEETDWCTKILHYADMRVTPSGIGSLEKRLQDIRARVGKYSDRPDFEQLTQACRSIEKQIQDNITINVRAISNIKNNNTRWLLSRII